MKSSLLLTVVACILLAYSVNAGKHNKFTKVVLEKIQEKLMITGLKNLQDIDGNAYVDSVLDEFRSEVAAQNLDPYKVEDIDFLGIHTTGYIAGYSTIHRKDDAAVTQTDTEVIITVDLEIVNLEGDFNWTTSFLGIEYSGSVDAQVDIVDAYLSMEGPIVEGSDVVYMECKTLEIQDIGRITIEVTGFGIFDELIDIITQAFTNLIEDLIPLIMNDVVQVMVNDVLANFPLPLPE